MQHSNSPQYYCCRKFVYEFQLNSNDTSVPHNHLASAEDNKQMACIEIPFRTVVGINASRSVPVEVILEIDTVPAVWLGKELIINKQNSRCEYSRYHYNTEHPVDLTGGQLFEVRYHKVCCWHHHPQDHTCPVFIIITKQCLLIITETNFYHHC